MHDPREPHFSALKRILCYVCETEYRGVANVVAETCWLRNLLRELHTHLSSVTLVYYDNVSAVYLSCIPVQHQRTKHIEIDIHFVRDLVVAGQAGCPTTRRSTSETEYRGVANVVVETCWLRNLLRELHTLLSSATLVYYDNVSAVYLSCIPVQHQRTKHIEIDIHFVRDLVVAGQVRFLHVLSHYQYADIFTKSLLPHYLRSFAPV
uniref:Ribonuclease H-like domain-containing protein n=1 Tax=Tanacetum cinerariifolium TaxID=118510 RepID=A0A699KL74_TANCI|nr:ribonuclease H-like domain-containing protein [Tanacetum cinerariifolium]